MSISIKILVADAEPIVYDFVTSIVKKEGLAVSDIFTCANGLQAVNLAKRENPDLAILDLCLPGLRGLEVGAQIREHSPRTLLYMVSVYDEFEYARSAFKMGFCDFYLKPVRPAYIIDMVNRALDKCKEANEVNEVLPQLVRDVNKYIEDYLDQPLALEDIAQAVFISSCYLSRKYKELSGQSITQTILDSRLKKAVELLTGTEQSITDIAQQVGFSNSSYFGTCFKAAYGLTPLQFRKNQRCSSLRKQTTDYSPDH